MSEGPRPGGPAYVERVASQIAGRPGVRLIVILRAIGCAWARRPDGGCTNCGFLRLSTGGAPVPAADLIAQFDAAIDAPGALDGVVEVDLYNSGSFLSDQEIPPAVRAHALGRLGRTAVRRVLIESRPEHVRADKLTAARALLGERELEVGIGLESCDDHVREVLVNKGFGRPEFERAVATLGHVGARLLAYVLIKPLGLDEAAAVEDAVASARYVFEVAARAGVPARVALEPVYVVPGTALERAYRAGRYAPASLWSVVEVVRRAHPVGELLVGLSEESLEPAASPAGCPRCTAALRAALVCYNATRDLAAFEGLDCPCRH